jgi:hypothetical protein
MNKIAAKHSPFKAAVPVGDVSFTIGTEASNAINLGMQFKDSNGQDIQERVACDFYLSDSATGDDISGTAATSLAIGTDGVLMTYVTGKAGKIVSEADGDVDIAIGYTTGAKTWYGVVVLPDGRLVVSSAITFA